LDIAVFQTLSANTVLTRMGASLARTLREQGVDAPL
jgi:hypothetical protein